ncbi:MAG: hypothetical protein LBK99_00230 [Opitutaceae bacterium]|jgi:hypothetical protein|nr:hypothetical protein [Opitutaceae bacterium]
MIKTFRLIGIIVTIVLFTCACVSERKNIEWTLLSCENLKEQVNNKSNKYQIWIYSGSDKIYHYLYRDTTKAFYGTRYYCKIRKSDCLIISPEYEQVFDGKLTFHAVVFSKRSNTIQSNTHSFERGLIPDGP